MSLAGVSPIIDSAVAASVDNAQALKSAKGFTVWQGLMAKHCASGNLSLMGGAANKRLLVNLAYVINKRASMYGLILPEKVNVNVLQLMGKWPEMYIRHWQEYSLIGRLFSTIQFISSYSKRIEYSSKPEGQCSNG